MNSDDFEDDGIDGPNHWFQNRHRRPTEAEMADAWADFRGESCYSAMVEAEVAWLKRQVAIATRVAEAFAGPSGTLAVSTSEDAAERAAAHERLVVALCELARALEVAE